jgi:hypothetical protein
MYRRKLLQNILNIDPKRDIKIEGIKYNSVKYHNRANIALFARQSDLIGSEGGRVGDQPWVELVGRCVRAISEAEMEQWTEQAPPRYFILGWDEFDEDAEEY